MVSEESHTIVYHVLEQQILKGLLNIKSSIFANYISSFLTFRWAETTCYELVFKIQKWEYWLVFIGMCKEKPVRSQLSVIVSVKIKFILANRKFCVILSQA